MEIAIIENRKDLERLEGIIEKNLTAFYEVGKALIQIKQREYYIDVLGYDTFEQYCRERWDMSKRHAYRLIDSCKVIDVVKSDQLVTPSTNPNVAHYQNSNQNSKSKHGRWPLRPHLMAR